MLAVTQRLCGVQAQLLSSAELALWARVKGLERRAIARALWHDRTLVKTWAMRGTLHLLPAKELELWHGALATSGRFLRQAVWQNYFGITLAELDRLNETIGLVLENRVLTREELAEEVSRFLGHDIGAKVAQGSWGTILRPAAFSGRLCFGPSQGQRVCFTSPKSWVGAGRPMDTHAATTEVARRFLDVNGPATYRDLARWWSGGSVSTARQWIAALGDEAMAIELDGAEAWTLRSHARQLRDFSPAPSVRLLPAFDQYVIAASCHAEHLLPGVPRSCVYRPQGWLSPVLLVNGFMQGVWRHEIKRSRLALLIEPFVKVSSAVRHDAEQEAEGLAEFFDCKLQLEWK